MFVCPITKSGKSSLVNAFCPMIFVGETTSGDVFWCKECGTIRYTDGGKRGTVEYEVANNRND